MLCWASGCRPGLPRSARVVEVKRQDLVVKVDVNGALKAIDSEKVSPPPVADTWEFKIVRMAAEGQLVKAGDEAMAFDTSNLMKRLADLESESASVTEELHKIHSEQALAELNGKLELEDANAKLRKASLKAEKPEDLTASLTLRLARIDRDLSNTEVERKNALNAGRRAREKAETASLTGRLARAQGRVRDIQAAIESMSVKARRPGTVVYMQDYRGEKRTVGDGMWRGQAVMEIASLDRMAAQGTVDEVDASLVSVGQRVALRLEAHPDREYSGVVERVAPLVRTESWESRVRVVGLDLRLEETDVMLMRPEMRFRGTIEVARAAKVLQVPLLAVQDTPTGPVVVKVSATRVAPVAVKLGRRSRDTVEVTDGLQEGDRVVLPTLGTPTDPGGGFKLGAS